MRILSSCLPATVFASLLAACALPHDAAAATITGEIADVTVNEGETATFTVLASGNGSLTYTWAFNGEPLPRYRNQWSISFPAGSHDAGNYQVSITDANGTISSRKARLTVRPLQAPPTIRLASLWTHSGTATISFVAPRSTGFPWTYQWYRDGIPLANGTSSTYYYLPASSQQSGNYFVVVTNHRGSTTSRTARAELTASRTPPAGGWIEAARSGDVVHFLFATPARIERYNLATESWLAPISLPRASRAFAMSNTHLYVASGAAIHRYEPDGTGESAFATLTAEVGGLLIHGDFVVAQTGENLAVIRQSDGAIVRNSRTVSRWTGSMVTAPSGSRVFGLTADIAPEDIVFANIAVDGTISGSGDSPYHGEFPMGARLYLSPDEQHLVSDTGFIFTPNTLQFSGTLAGAVDDIAFVNESELVTLRAQTIAVHRLGVGERGRISLDAPAARIFVRGDQAYAFARPLAGGSIGVAKRALSAATKRPTGSPLDGSAVGFTPDLVLKDRDGVVLLYSKLHGQIFRWSAATRQFLPPLLLDGWPDFVTYSPVKHRLYTGHADGRVLQIKLDAGSVTEEPYAVVPGAVSCLVAAGEFVFAIGPPALGARVFSADGALVASTRTFWANRPVWDPVRKRIVYFPHDYAAVGFGRVGITPEGTLVDWRSPFDSTNHPKSMLSLSPDGAIAIAGGTAVYDTETLSPTGSLTNEVDEAAWLGSHIFTARNSDGAVELQRWSSPPYAIEATKTVKGRFAGLFAHTAGSLLLVAVREGVTCFTFVDSDLRELETVISSPLPQLVNVSTRGWAGRGADTLTPSFVIGGSSEKRVLVRCSGPALARFGVGNLLADPALTVFNGASMSVSSNDAWDVGPGSLDVASAISQVGAFPFLAGSPDAAVLLTLPSGSYSVQARGADGGTGVALVEAYALDGPNAGAGRFVNIAARAYVGPGDAVLTPAVVIAGSTPKTLLIRAIGPGLRTYGLTEVLTDPILKLYRGQTVLAENDDWDDGYPVERLLVTTLMRRTGAFPLTEGSLDSAMVVTLPPGSYTAQATGAFGGSGVALVEIYEVAD